MNAQAYAGTMAAEVVAERPAEATQAQATAPGAVASVVCGVIGFFVFGIILGCVAIGKANAAKKLIAEHPGQYTGGGMATTGLVLGVIDLVGWAVTMVMLIAS